MAVVGLGPAGRALAHRLLQAGAEVLVIDPRPERVWRQTLSGWRHQLPGWLDDQVVASTARPVLRTRGTQEIDDPYLVLDNTALHTRLSLAGARVEETRVGPDGFAALTSRAHWVIDARGATPAGRRRRVPMQTAHGVVVPTRAAAGVLAGAEAVLMDWTPFDGSSRWQEPASFLYAVEVAPGRELLEETCLAGEPPLPPAELQRRLHRRLQRYGVPPDAIEGPGATIERVRIPMLPSAADPLPDRVIRFGAAGGQLNPITGYSALASLRDTDTWVNALTRGDPGRLPQRPDPLARTALGAFLQLSPAATVELFDAFARLPTEQQRVVFDGRGAGFPAALFAQWQAMPPAGRLALIAATARSLLTAR